ncbi:MULTISPECIES: GNAT family N-acetyltransferase [Vibrio]|uniref:GNAT family N-acetyltransferase n=1 Tax=Vibrio chanodichtyis TaxID=3027932 RepID=A0ABT5UWV2_9VIBR|nr:MULTISPECIES: GNAT family N-acetyltransferase [Vibrio]MDE1513895.1 GNAT family N-acetyltransferase [Vibrio chanodichtyis]
MKNTVYHDVDHHCYRVVLEGDYQAVVSYQYQDQQANVLYITSTRVPDEMQGKGYGSVMMESVLPEIERAGLTIVPVCSYVAHYLERHPQWQHLRHRATTE